MSKIYWANQEQSIIVWKFEAGDTTESLLEATREFSAMAQAKEGPVYAITDMLDFRTIPANAMGMFPSMARLLPPENKRPRVIAIVTRRQTIITLVDLFARVYPGYQDRFVNFDTQEEALAHIRRIQAETRPDA